jgi:hypothetical protein
MKYPLGGWPALVGGLGGGGAVAWGAGCRWGRAVLNYWRRGRIGFYTVKFKARIGVGQWLERALLRPRWTPLALNSFTVWPWLGPADLRWSRGRKDI